MESKEKYTQEACERCPKLPEKLQHLQHKIKGQMIEDCVEVKQKFGLNKNSKNLLFEIFLKNESCAVLQQRRKLLI